MKLWVRSSVVEQGTFGEMVSVGNSIKLRVRPPVTQNPCVGSSTLPEPSGELR